MNTIFGASSTVVTIIVLGISEKILRQKVWQNKK